MRKLRRRRNKKQVHIVLAVAICLISVMTVGYAAFSTNISLNAKGNIIKKQATTAAELLKANVVTEGDGLYKDPTEEGRYVYKGAAPDNYIKLDNDVYRIISVEKDNTLKIVKQDSLGAIVFDPGYSTSIDGVTSSSSTDGTRYTSTSTDYCYTSSASSYQGCSVWGSKTTILDTFGNNTTQMPRVVGGTTYNLPEDEAYINVYLNGGTYQGVLIAGWYNTLSDIAKSKVEEHTWNVGPTKSQSGQTLETDLQQESAYKWKGKIGLINITDYVRANTNTELCGNVYGNRLVNGETCKTTTWLFNSAYQWTMTPYSANITKSVYDVTDEGDVGGSIVYYDEEIHPALYLKSDIQLTGTGTETDPYIIS